MPVLCTKITTIWDTSTDHDDTEDDETGDCNDFNNGKDKFYFAENSHAKQVNKTQEQPKYEYPYGGIYVTQQPIVIAAATNSKPTETAHWQA